MSKVIPAYRRFFHWGPIIALSIIKCVTVMTLYMNRMWWPPNETIAGFINQSIFLVLSSLAMFNYIMATVTGPGYLENGWKPKNEKDQEFLQYCKVCEGYKAPRSHHCRKCGRCVKKMDHHCPWINNCVGWLNHAYFTSFLGFAVLGCIHATIILTASFYRGIHRQYYIYHGELNLATVQFGIYSLILCIFSLGLSVGVVIAVGMLLYFQIRAIFHNRTGIEDWILEKAICRRQQQQEHAADVDKDKFIFPYDLGIMKNIKQVMNFSCSPIGDGVEWNVAEGCDQYTLTREQIAQKFEKRARTKIYTIIKPSTGSILPLFSQGFRVCLSPPYTDEPRIKLSPGDNVKVTRWRKYWLFGERLPSDHLLKHKKNAINLKDMPKQEPEPRGWFPRQCAVSLDNPDDQQCDSDFDEKKVN